MTGFQDTLPIFGDPDEAACPSGGARQPSYLRDHRARLRDRFRTGGAAALPDYEMLELLLFRSIPRQDVKPLARALIDHFGDLNGVLSATPDRLGRIKGVGDAVITDLKLVEAATHRMARGRVMQRHVVSSWDALLDYCHTVMSHRDTEQFRILFLDTRNTLIADEAQASGTIDHVPVYPREVVKRALELNAASLILVHNHPSGDPTPSDADIAMTRQIAAAAETMRITVHDHLIIGKSRELSFRAEGLL
ncbi:DNA repair protein RadC [Loktanella sp. DSM 29012]|uniref:RadC family protein n=1 Tax=Loktanella sp. DSM 29012 TaxID=1881056 RepID=UPI0008B82D71|nr:DNA repair protein RadC [Loktanella sp. DSM 29012]SEP59321.1 DNA repair protein RadC [Loktanella sp. DSM 29012]